MEELLAPGAGGAACGGTLVQESGRIVASTRAACGAGGAGGGSLIWRIQVPEGRVVHLSFAVFQLERSDKDTRVKVRGWCAGCTQISQKRRCWV